MFKNSLVFVIAVQCLFGTGSGSNVGTLSAVQLRGSGVTVASRNPAILGFEIPQVDTTILENELVQDDSIKAPPTLPSMMGSKFSMSLVDVDLSLQNNGVSANWINNSLFGGLDLRHKKDYDQFMEPFGSDIGLQIPVQFHSLNFTYKSFGVHWVQPKVLTNMNIPNSFVKMVINGVEDGNKIDLSSLSFHSLAYMPISFQYGGILSKKVKGKEIFYGIGLNLNIGLSEFNGTLENASIHIEEGVATLAGASYLNSNMSVDTLLNPGFGVGLDVGFMSPINQKLTVGLSLKNIGTGISFEGKTGYEGTLAGTFQSDKLFDALSDSSDVYLTQMENNTGGAYSVSLPIEFALSGSYTINPMLVTDVTLMTDFGPSPYKKGTKLVSSMEYALTGKNTVQLSAGINSLSGLEIGMGHTLKIGSFNWDFGIAQSGGVLSQGKGVRFGTGFWLDF